MIAPVLDQGCCELSRATTRYGDIRRFEKMRTNIVAQTSCRLLQTEVKWREKITVECDRWLRRIAVRGSIRRANRSNCYFLSFMA